MVPFTKLPSSLKYVAVPPEPLSVAKFISPSSCLLNIVKLPVSFSMYELLPSWYICKSCEAPNLILPPFPSIAINKSLLATKDVIPPSNLKYSAVPPLPSSHLKIILLSSAVFSMYMSPVLFCITPNDPLCLTIKSWLLPNLASLVSVKSISSFALTLIFVPPVVFPIASVADKDLAGSNAIKFATVVFFMLLSVASLNHTVSVVAIPFSWGADSIALSVPK